MKSVPKIVSQGARAGVNYIYAVDIVPRATDGWSTKRFSSKSIKVGGNAYTAGLLKSITRLTQSADLEKGGIADTADSVTLRLYNEDATPQRLHDLFGTDRIEGREAQIAVSAISSNIIKNGSAEDSMNDWTVITGDPSAGLGPNSGFSYHSANSFKVFWNSGWPTRPEMKQTVRIPRGGYFNLTFWQYNVIDLAYTTAVQIKQLGASRWWNKDTGLWQGTSYNNTFVNSALSTWEQFRIQSAWHDWDTESFFDSDDDHYVDIEVIFTLDADAVLALYWDAIQLETWAVETDYLNHAQSLEAADLMKNMVGVVRKASWDGNEFQMVIESLQVDRHREVPVTIIDEDSTGLAAGIIPRDSRGKPFPMTYGEDWGILDRGSFFGELGADYKSGTGQLMKGYLIDVSDPTVVFDRPGMNLNEIKNVCHYDETAGYYYRELFDDATVPAYVANEWEKFPANARAQMDSSAFYLQQRRAPFMLWTRPEFILQIVDGGNWSNTENILDRTIGTVANYTGSGVGSLDVRLEQHELEHTNIIDMWVIARVGNPAGSGNPLITAQLRGVFLSYNGPVVTIVNTTSGFFHNVPWDVSPPAATEKETDLPYTVATRTNFIRHVTDDMKMLLKVDHSGQGGSPSSYVDEFGIRIDFSYDLGRVKFCAEGDGRRYLTTWDGRKTVGLNINTQVDVIEDVLRTELVVPGTEINTSIFDSTRADIISSSYSMAPQGQVIERTDSEELIDQMCQEGFLLYFLDYDGRHAVRPLIHGSTVATLKRSDFQFGSVKCKWTDYRKAYNDFRVNYRKNQFTGKYSKHSYCNKAGSDLITGAAGYEAKCLAGFNAVGVVNKHVVNADWVWSDDGANNYIKWMVDWFSIPRLVLEGKMFLDHIGLELGDRVDLNRGSLAKYIPSSVPDDSVFMLFERSISLKTRAVSVKLLEVKSAVA